MPGVHQVKAALCLVFTLALWPHVSLPGGQMPAHPFSLIVLLAGELILGLMLGMTVHFLFAGIQTGGQMLATQMGFTMITLADPLTGANVSITSHFLYMVAMLTFLALDGHLYMLRAFVRTFELVPPGGLLLGPSLVKEILALSGSMFVLAVKIAAPVLVSLFLVELALALMARAAPQMNLLMIGFPLKIAVGFFFIGMLFTIMADKICTCCGRPARWWTADRTPDGGLPWRSATRARRKKRRRNVARRRAARATSPSRRNSPRP